MSILVVWGFLMTNQSQSEFIDIRPLGNMWSQSIIILFYSSMTAIDLLFDIVDILYKRPHIVSQLVCPEIGTVLYHWARNTLATLVVKICER